MACRNQERADAAKEQILKDYPKAKGKLTVILLDLANLESRDNFVKEV